MLSAVLRRSRADDGKYFRARIFWSDREAQKAATDLAVVTRLAPRFAAAFYYLGQAQVRLGKSAEAKANYIKAGELLPNWQLPHLSLAQVYLGEGSIDLAVDEVNKVLLNHPKNVSALMLSGAAWLKKGESDKALQIFKQVAQGSVSKLPSIGAAA